MQRIDDAEFGRRARERNLRANTARRQRLANAGYTQWNLWIDTEVRRLAEALAQQQNQTPAELVSALVKSAAQANSKPVSPTRSASEPTPAAPDPLPLLDPASTEREHPRPVSVESALDLGRDAMRVQIGAMVETGMTGATIARELGKQGFKASNGAELRGANVLREYRQWCEKNGLNAHGELKQ